jgi:RNA-directed DNA polymerase
MTQEKKHANRRRKKKRFGRTAMPGMIHNFNIEKIFGKPQNEVDDILNNKEKHISKIEIPKKDGSPRKVIAPDRELKYIQKSLYWKFFRRYKPHEAAHGFVAKKGISTNADFHVGAESIGKIDISNFFDSISSDHLKNVLFGNRHICRYCKYYERMLDGRCNPSLYKNKASKFDFRCEEIKAVFIPNFCMETGYQSLFNRIIEACTYKGFTAQGFPTSPVIANIVLRGFDGTMHKYCEENGIAYTRYADDLAFSSKTHKKDELRDLTLKKAYQQLWAYKFKPNRKKTIYKGKAGRLKICGVIVNEHKNIQRSEIHKFRAKVHHATVKFPNKTTKIRLRRLKGFASFVMSINYNKGKYYMDKLVAFEKSKFK